jgi:hypothetical protein
MGIGWAAKCGTVSTEKLGFCKQLYMYFQPYYGFILLACIAHTVTKIRKYALDACLAYGAAVHLLHFQEKLVSTKPWYNQKALKAKQATRRLPVYTKK